MVTYPSVVVARKRTTWGGRRSGAGRRPKLKEPTSVTLDVEKPQIDALREIAQEEDLSVAQVIREAIAAYLRRRRR